MKRKALSLVSAALLVSVLAACGDNNEETAGNEVNDNNEENVNDNENEEDGMTGATYNEVMDEDSLLSYIGADGAWILHFYDDVTTDQDLVMEGDQENRDEPERKLALYEQDEDRNVTETHTLEAPSLTVRNENGRLQYGGFIGDIYVEANGFVLNGMTVEGDVHFAGEEYFESSDISEDTEISGTIYVDGEEMAMDGMTGATYHEVMDEESLLSYIGADGAWILHFYGDITTDEDLVMEGDQENRDEPERKLALYEQDADRNVTETHTLEAPSLTVRNENGRLQYGTFVGDIYVEANGFVLNGMTVEGNVYFASEEYEASADISDDTEISGSVEVQ
ncbi:hypothetical protein [Salisediminibacterium selenitireducens]|uniref:Lipoprotein n=1 Tax=Bacillus selenitireducens (strain ATCC 700615 / DSM 15326 / MLS10) TaxID=439292 RepID=D6XZ87_BACIE|nr:hypothetical protein [Salisediminibacterium selenitireducens]ADI00372.1 hypothetical protein Bsel_2883 [[Bacillus] selenitireducens MLS10]